MAKFRAAELHLNEEQHNGMCRIAETIEATEREELDKLFTEGDAHGVGEVLKNVWEIDHKKQRDQFLCHLASCNSKCFFC